jgi:hypothetical protein
MTTQHAGGDEQWVLVYEQGPGQHLAPVGTRLSPGQELLIGRRGDLALGVDLDDTGISREALLVVATDAGWDVEIHNANGAVLHAWGQAPVPVSGRQSIAWPRVALRILNGKSVNEPGGDRLHWVLLEADWLAVTPAGPSPARRSMTSTVRPEPPPPLTAPQEAAIRLLFADLLAWPPRLPGLPLQVKQAATRLDISNTGVRERLEGAQAKALKLGLHHDVGLTNPDYVYVLASHGYLAPPTATDHRRALPWLE